MVCTEQKVEKKSSVRNIREIAVIKCVLNHFAHGT